MKSAPATCIPDPITRNVLELRGVGKERAEQLARLNIHTVENLLLHRPRRYEDRRQFRPIAELQLNESTTTRGTITAMGVRRFHHGRKSVFELILDDGTARLHCRWWNLPFMEKYFSVGQEVVAYGKLLSLKPRTFDHPETEIVEAGEENFIHLNRLTPVYPLTEGLPQRWLRSLIWRTLESYEAKITEPNVSIPLPSAFISRSHAVHLLHIPASLEDTATARERLALDEFIEQQRQLQLRRQRFETSARAFPCGGNNRLIRPFLAGLGFHLTEAQTRALREIRADLGGAHPMRRLLQGDVGSGKTCVAACAALMALESGFSAALMAPTEVLAGQHHRNFSRWFEPLRVPVRLRTGSHKDADGRDSKLASRQSPAPSTLVSPPSTLFIGTHALLSEQFAPPNLGLVIIDEQHKFGVSQREQLLRKGRYPHLLVMTATPIPRTLGLTLYGELDASVIDQLPPGRSRIQTHVRAPDALPKIWSFVRETLARGRQVYVVYPRVEDAGKDEVKAVTREFANLRAALAPFKVGLLHGRLKEPDKETVMAAFRDNHVQVLLTTSLIEVGIDVPNASVMVIENAEQFGLAQLHQLRGRIGRGSPPAHCILVSSVPSGEPQSRLAILKETTDGFRIAEADLALRGPGELLGQEQSGMPRFCFGDLTRDLDLIKQAREIVARNFRPSASTPSLESRSSSLESSRPQPGRGMDQTMPQNRA